MMHYLIDGHNLIPKAGLNLSDPDDEMSLIELLGRFQRATGLAITVFFDRAPRGHQGSRRIGNIHAVFVPEGKTADQAIAEALARNKTSAPNITLVSSDRQVQAAGRERRTRVVSSDQFARQLRDALAATASPTPSQPEDDIEEWLRLFSEPPEANE